MLAFVRLWGWRRAVRGLAFGWRFTGKIHVAAKQIATENEFGELA